MSLFHNTSTFMITKPSVIDNFYVIFQCSKFRFLLYLLYYYLLMYYLQPKYNVRHFTIVLRRRIMYNVPKGRFSTNSGCNSILTFIVRVELFMCILPRPLLNCFMRCISKVSHHKTVLAQYNTVVLDWAYFRPNNVFGSDIKKEQGRFGHCQHDHNLSHNFRLTFYMKFMLDYAWLS